MSCLSNPYRSLAECTRSPFQRDRGAASADMLCHQKVIKRIRRLVKSVKRRQGVGEAVCSRLAFAASARRMVFIWNGVKPGCRARTRAM